MKHVPTLKAARRIFREWCMEHGAVVDVEMAADLVRRIKTAIDAESAALTADAEITRLRTALEIIAGRRQCIDNLLSNVEIACLALDKQHIEEFGKPVRIREYGKSALTAGQRE